MVKLRGLDCCRDKFYWCRKAFIGIETIQVGCREGFSDVETIQRSCFVETSLNPSRHPTWIVEMPINSLEAPVTLSRQKNQALEVLPRPHMYLYGVLEILCGSSKLKPSFFKEIFLRNPLNSKLNSQMDLHNFWVSPWQWSQGVVKFVNAFN